MTNDNAEYKQVVRISSVLVSEARRADRSLVDLISVGDVVRLTATASNRRVGDPAAAAAEDVVLAQPATLTVDSPPSPATDAAITATVGRGKLNVVTYRGGRVDASAECVPCAYDYSATRRRIDIRVWQLSGIGYVSNQSICQILSFNNVA